MGVVFKELNLKKRFYETGPIVFKAYRIQRKVQHIVSDSPFIGQIRRQFKLQSGSSGRLLHWFVSCRQACRPEGDRLLLYIRAGVRPPWAA